MEDGLLSPPHLPFISWAVNMTVCHAQCRENHITHSNQPREYKVRTILPVILSSQLAFLLPASIILPAEKSK